MFGLRARDGAVPRTHAWITRLRWCRPDILAPIHVQEDRSSVSGALETPASAQKSRPAPYFQLSIALFALKRILGGRPLRSASAAAR